MNEYRQKANIVVKKLRNNGYVAYFAGGFVRDMLLGKESYDIDIATDALPHIIAKIFPGTRLVGAHFGVAMVPIENVFFEVATFRSDANYVDGRHPEQVKLHSNPYDDAARRDFTINGLFYDPEADKIIDYVGGTEDIRNKLIRTIGDPYARFQEDKLRIIRACRFAAVLDFDIDQTTRKAIVDGASSITSHVSSERIWQELQKMAQAKKFAKGVHLLYELSVLRAIFPNLTQLSYLEFQKHMNRIDLYEEKVSPILILARLFSDNASILKLSEILKTSTKEKNKLEIYINIKKLLSTDLTFSKQYSWAHVLAHEYAWQAIYANIIGYPEETKSLEQIAHLEKTLFPYIERIQTRKPIVTACDLEAQGIVPGKQMGLLLKKCEEIAIVHKLQTKEEVLTQLNREV